MNSRKEEYDDNGGDNDGHDDNDDNDYAEDDHDDVETDDGEDDEADEMVLIRTLVRMMLIAFVMLAAIVTTMSDKLTRKTLKAVSLELQCTSAHMCVYTHISYVYMFVYIYII